jgi:hypothetical protein
MTNINMGSSPSRPMSFARGGDVNVAPGQYDDGQRFNSNVKSFKIGEKREERMTRTLGPGAYDHEKSDAVTKSKMPNVTMGGSPSRPASFAKGGDVNVAPGQYDDGQRWNSNVKSFKIGEKRAERAVEGMGPGAYSPERADAMTKPKFISVNLSSSPERPDNFTNQNDNGNVAPG